MLDGVDYYPYRKKSKWNIWTILLIFIIAAAGGISWWFYQNPQSSGTVYQIIYENFHPQDAPQNLPVAEAAPPAETPLVEILDEALENYEDQPANP